jgi:hypothetical protein
MYERARRARTVDDQCVLHTARGLYRWDGRLR